MHTAGLRVTFLALFAAAAATLVLSAPGRATPNKPYSIVICGGGQTGCTSANPAVTAPGGTTASLSALSVTFTNDNKPGSGIQLGSDNLNVPSTPAGFGVTSASLPTTPPTPPTPLPQCPASFNSSAPLCVIFSNGDTTAGFRTIGFRNLNLAPGESIQINMSAVTPPPSTTACTTTSPCFWTDEAKQSNDFNGTGNDLNSDSNSAYGTVTAAATFCPQKQGCSTTLADGGNATGAPSSVSVTVSTSSGKTAVTQIQALDFGPPLPANLCSNVSALHFSYWKLSNGADNGSGRSQTVSITTTPPSSGFLQEFCLETSQQFTQKVLPAGNLEPANQVTLPDGSPGFQGLLPNCVTQVDCKKLPGVLRRVTNPDGTRTTVAMIPPGFDARGYN